MAERHTRRRPPAPTIQSVDKDSLDLVVRAIINIDAALGFDEVKAGYANKAIHTRAETLWGYVEHADRGRMIEGAQKESVDLFRALTRARRERLPEGWSADEWQRRVKAADTEAALADALKDFLDALEAPQLTQHELEPAIEQLLRTSDWGTVTVKQVMLELERVLVVLGKGDLPAGWIAPHKKAVKRIVDARMVAIAAERQHAAFAAGGAGAPDQAMTSGPAHGAHLPPSPPQLLLEAEDEPGDPDGAGAGGGMEQEQAAPAADLSSYEAQRRENVRQNDEVLAQLGLRGGLGLASQQPAPSPSARVTRASAAGGGAAEEGTAGGLAALPAREPSARHRTQVQLNAAAAEPSSRQRPAKSCMLEQRAQHLLGKLVCAWDGAAKFYNVGKVVRITDKGAEMEWREISTSMPSTTWPLSALVDQSFPLWELEEELLPRNHLDTLQLRHGARVEVFMADLECTYAEATLVVVTGPSAGGDDEPAGGEEQTPMLKVQYLEFDEDLCNEAGERVPLVEEKVVDDVRPYPAGELVDVRAWYRELKAGDPVDYRDDGFNVWKPGFVVRLGSAHSVPSARILSQGDVVAFATPGSTDILRPGIVMRRAPVSDDDDELAYEVLVDFATGEPGVVDKSPASSGILRVGHLVVFKMDLQKFGAGDRVRVQRANINNGQPFFGRVLPYAHARQQPDEVVSWVYMVETELGASVAEQVEIHSVEECFLARPNGDADRSAAGADSGPNFAEQRMAYAIVAPDPNLAGPFPPRSVAREHVRPRLIFRHNATDWRTIRNGDLMPGKWRALTATRGELKLRSSSRGNVSRCLEQVRSVEQFYVQGGECRSVLLLQRAVAELGDAAPAIWSCTPQEGLCTAASVRAAREMAARCWDARLTGSLADQPLLSPGQAFDDIRVMRSFHREKCAALARSELRILQLERQLTSGCEQGDQVPPRDCQAALGERTMLEELGAIRRAFAEAPGIVVAVFGGTASGKSRLCRAWVDALEGEQRSAAERSLEQPQWEAGTPLVESPHFASAEDACERLHSAGLSSVPTQLRPYAQLSGGEQERADIARRLCPGAVLEDIGVRVNTAVAQSIAWSIQRACRTRRWSSLISTSSIDVVRFLCADVILWIRPDGLLEVLGRGGGPAEIITIAGALPSADPDFEPTTFSPYGAELAAASRKAARAYRTTALPRNGALLFGAHSTAIAANVSLDLENKTHVTTRLPTSMGVPESDFVLGVMVGPSGSGKTQLARRAFSRRSAPALLALEDGTCMVLDALALECAAANLQPGAAERLEALALGGLSQRRLSELSSGELSCVRVAASLRDLVFIDEFTSALDRTTARQFCRLFVDAIHTFKLREVVVSSVHVDVASWLAEQVAEHAEGPELGPRDIWVYSTAEFDVLPLDRLPRPKLPDAAGVRALLTGAPRLQLTMRRCSQDWYSARFAQHHYLSNSLAPSSLCMLARLRELSDGEEPDFCAAGGGGDAVVGFVCSMVHPGKAAHREHRLVVLPDFQGLGLGSKISGLYAECLHLAVEQTEYFSVTAQPSFGRSRDSNALWKARMSSGKCNPQTQYPTQLPTQNSRSRRTFSHVYAGVRSIAQLVSGVDGFARQQPSCQETPRPTPSKARRVPADDETPPTRKRRRALLRGGSFTPGEGSSTTGADETSE